MNEKDLRRLDELIARWHLLKGQEGWLKSRTESLIKKLEQLSDDLQDAAYKVYGVKQGDKVAVTPAVLKWMAENNQVSLLELDDILEIDMLRPAGEVFIASQSLLVTRFPLLLLPEMRQRALELEKEDSTL